MMKSLSLFGFAIIAISLGIARFRIKYPDGMENSGFKRQFSEQVLRLVYRLAITAERLGLLSDSAYLVQDFIAKVTKKPAIKTTLISGVPVIISRPKSNLSKQRAIVYFHGGGFTVGSASTYYSLTSMLADEGHAIVVSVDYRLAPRYPYPSALNDCLQVTKAVFDAADEMGIDSNRIAVAGDSAGANLASVIALELADSERYRLKAQVLISLVCIPPGAVPLESCRLFSYLYSLGADWFLAKLAGQPYSRAVENSILSRKYMTIEDTHRIAAQLGKLDTSLLPDSVRSILEDKAYLNLSNSGVDRATFQKFPNELKEIAKLASTQRSWPLTVKDRGQFAKLPATFLCVCGFDMRRDEGLLYYVRLATSSVPVTLSYLPHAEHNEPVLHVITGVETTDGRQGIDDMLQFIEEKL